MGQNVTLSRENELDFSVAKNASVSSLKNTRGRTPKSFLLPSALETNTDRIQFLGAMDSDDTPALIYDDAGAKVYVKVTTSAWVSVGETVLNQIRDFPYLQIQLADSSGSAVSQATAARTITALVGKI